MVYGDSKTATLRLDGAVREAVATVSRRCPEATVRTDLEPCRVRAHVSIERAVENVVENGCEHAESLRITVETEVGAGTAPLAVTDDGPCVPRQEIEVLEAGTETGILHGTGLGLWIVKLAVEPSDGRLHFECSDGTRIEMVLPGAGG